MVIAALSFVERLEYDAGLRAILAGGLILVIAANFVWDWID